MDKKKVSVFWFRRDLRLEDNCGLFEALKSDYPVLPVFIFDAEILDELPKNDARISFIHHSLQNLNEELQQLQASLYIQKGAIMDVWKKIIREFDVKNVYFNKDYEPYAIKRDVKITALCKANNIEVHAFKDQVIFEENEIVKADAKPYSVYTPYKNKWWELYKNKELKFYPSEDLKSHFLKTIFNFPSIKEIGFEVSNIKAKSISKNAILDYEKFRDFPLEETSNLSVYLRFGLVSVRKLFKYAASKNITFCNELIWREFFMQILYHFPFVVNQNFKPKYNFINWRNNEEEFKLWCKGETGYPIVDAGMRELNKTGYMHNRVRMITASFLTKHLLIDWRWGEAYFAKKLLDFDLAANNGNWQWVAGTGCDAAPYFRVFNPATQLQKFDQNFEYIKKWNPNYTSIPEIVEHKFARERYLEVVKASLI